METYISTVLAKPGHENEVAAFYKDLEPLMRDAKGFRGRKVFQAKTGAMAEVVRKVYPPEDLAKMKEPAHEDKATQFIMVEEWDSMEDRITFSRTVAGGRSKSLIPHLLPQHSHEFYDDIIGA